MTLPVSSARLGSVDVFHKPDVGGGGHDPGAGWALAGWEPLAEGIVVPHVYDQQRNHGQSTIPLLAIAPGSTLTTCSTPRQRRLLRRGVAGGQLGRRRRPARRAG